MPGPAGLPAATDGNKQRSGDYRERTPGASVAAEWQPAGAGQQTAADAPPPVPAPPPPPPGKRLASHPAVGFVPWILFWVIGGPSSWETAAIAALVAAIAVMAV